jgi:hypothetical protein
MRFLKWFGNSRKAKNKGLVIGVVSVGDILQIARMVQSQPELIKALRQIVGLKGLTNREREVAFHMARKIAIDAILQAEELEAKVENILKSQEARS